MKPNTRSGFTLMELLIVVAIIMILLLLVMLNLRSQLAKGSDSKRKTDIALLQTAFEEYFNDNKCYPNADILDTCGSSALSPYMIRIPCDPSSRQKYLYVSGTPTQCSGYRICTKLQFKSDPDIERVGCDPELGCSFAEGYNYCVTVGNADVYTPSGGPMYTPTPTPTPYFGGTYACRRGGGSGVCNNVGDPVSMGCPQAFSENDCRDLCDNSWYWCAY